MKDTKIQDIMIEDRGSFYGCDRETFFRKGTTFKHRESLDGKDILYTTRLFDHTFITTGCELISKLFPHGEMNLDGTKLKEQFPSLQYEMAYPHFFYRRDKIDIPNLPEGYEIVPADPADHKLLQQFLDGCTDEDIEDALIDLDDPDEEIRLVFHKGKPVGYGAYRRWGKMMGDVGILIQKEHRMKGLGKAAVAAATEACLNNDCLPFYRTSRENTGSQSIARNLGYNYEWETFEYRL